MKDQGVKSGSPWTHIWEGGRDRGSLGAFSAALYAGTCGQQGQGELRRGKGHWVHLELAQHGVTALPQVSQVQAPLVILESLEQRKEGFQGAKPGTGTALSDPR